MESIQGAGLPQESGLRQSSLPQTQICTKLDPATPCQQPHQAYTVQRCPRDLKVWEQDASYEAQLPAQLAWLKTVKTSIRDLAQSDGPYQAAPLSVPWQWLLQDVLRLLPETSCYTVLLEDPGILSQFLHQTTKADSGALSTPGRKMMAQIISELAQEAPEALLSYAKTHDAILQRLKQVCTELQLPPETDQTGACQAEVKSYALTLADSFLKALQAKADTTAQLDSLKLACSIIQLLPHHLHSTALTELLLPHPTMTQLYLQGKAVPGQQLAHLRLAAHMIQTYLDSTSTDTSSKVNKVAKWQVWNITTASATATPEVQVATAHLAFLVNRLMHASCFRNLKSQAQQAMITYAHLVQTRFQPNQLQHRTHAWNSSHKDGHTADLVRWVALLFCSAKQLGPVRPSWSYYGEAYQHLSATAAAVDPKAVNKSLRKDMMQALQQLKQASLISNASAVIQQMPQAQAQAQPASSTQPQDAQEHSVHGPQQTGKLQASTPEPAGNSCVLRWR